MRFGVRDEGIFILLDEEETKRIIDTYSKEKGCSYIFVSGNELKDLKRKISAIKVSANESNTL